ncbi:NnrU family protein [Gemmobacter fulvus]|uniref:NnrU family protein n=1 Tax=Gemmobacter fulvus TaxID=2840474 RepID=UPI002796C055|nr:NnrU family protein [Gemmobacter fulvus]MDQ1847583.1 NnrU family protein [Gemmobacter fulvus]
MIFLSLGLFLWVAAHLFKRLAPDARAALGDRGKGLVTALLVLAVGLMALGYRGAEFVPVYAPLPGMGHLNNTLMLISLFLFGVGGTKGTLYPRIRHPMLWGTVIWSLAHLAVNGDRASLLLFGGIGLWAVVEMLILNRTSWVRPVGGRGLKGDAMNLVGTLLLFGAIAMVHLWLGHPVFEGTYF